MPIRTKDHPESLKEIKALEVTDEIKTFVATLKSDIESEATEKAEWDNRIKELRDLRYGYRNVKTYPWKDCANYSIPVIDSHISKLKPIYINLFHNASPIVNFEPYGAEDIDPARKREQLFDWRMRTKINFFDDYCIGIDKMLEQGQTVYKIIWEYSTRSYTEYIDLEELDEKTIEALHEGIMTDDDLFNVVVQEKGVDTDFEENIEEIKKAIEKFREGETKLELTLLEVKDNQPKVIACDVKEDLTIPRDTTDIQFARFIDHKVWMTENDIKIAMEDEKYNKFPDSDLEAWGSKSGTQSTNRRSRGTTKENEVIMLHEVCCWYDVNDDGIKERCIATFPDADESAILRFIEIPYDHGKFPYEQVRRELNDPLFYTSRGIPELDEDFQIGITHAINQAEDYGTITNVPTIVMKHGTVTNIRNKRYIPGETVEVTQGEVNDYQIRQGTNVAQPALLQFTQYLKSWSDQRVGDVTAGIGSPTNLTGQSRSGQKTKAEINLISVLSQGLSSLDVLIFQQQMVKVYEQIDALYDQYGDDEEEILITGEEPIKVTRKDIQGKYNMVPNGRLENTDPAKKVAIATNILQVGANDPDVKQDELKRYYYNSIDPRLAKKLLYTNEEKQQMQQQMQQMQERLKQVAIRENLELKQIDILLEVQKEAMLVPIQGRKFAPDPMRGTPKKKYDERPRSK